MVDAVAGARRWAPALAVVVGMMLALITACCCLDLDHAPGAVALRATPVAAQPGASHHVTAGRDGGHSDEDCQESVAPVAVGSASVPGPSALAVAVAGGVTTGQITPWALSSVRGASPPPVPHLLCVMRT